MFLKKEHYIFFQKKFNKLINVLSEIFLIRKDFSINELKLNSEILL